MPFAETKSIFESKTFWVNFLTTAAGVITYLAGEAWIKEIPGGEATLLVVLGLVNVALRFITVDTVKILAVVMAVGLALSASPAAACAPGDIAISKAEGEEITRELQAKAQAERDLASIDVARDCENCRAMRKQSVKLTPAQARWFQAMPLPRVAKVVIREMFGL